MSKTMTSNPPLDYKLNIKRVRAKNVLCFGEDGICLNFSDYSNLVLIKGVNYDNPGSSDEDRSNGSGKSSIPELLSVGFYGIRIRNPKKNKTGSIIHNSASQGEVEIIWNQYRVVRTFKRKGKSASSRIRIWESKEEIWDDSTEITRSSLKKNQEWIENKLGLDHFSFCSVVVFDDSDYYQFLEMDLPQRRLFVEKLLGLEMISSYYEVAKDARNTNKRNLEKLMIEYNAKKQELSSLKNNISMTASKEKEWSERVVKDIKEYENKLVKVSKIINDAKKKYDGILYHCNTLEDKISSLKESIIKINTKISSNKQKISRLLSVKTGEKCSLCFSILDKNSCLAAAKNLEKENKKLLEELKQLNSLISALNSEYESKYANCVKLQDVIRQAENKQKMFQNEINKSKSDNSPYGEILESMRNEYRNKLNDLRGKEQEISKLEKLAHYYSFWVNAFSESGIRKYVVDRIIPSLNKKINYWLGVLIDNKISVSFDNELNENVIRNGVETSYFSLSKGETRRVNLAISQAFAYIMMVSSHSFPNIVFLDEITGGAIDRNGTLGVYSMIQELSKTRQVFVTTHNENLLKLLEGHDIIKLEKRNDVSRLGE